VTTDLIGDGEELP
jgi:hypothetical protein